MSEERLVPKLRFSGFDDEWKSVKLNETGEIVTGATPPTDDKDNFTDSGYIWVTPGDIDSKKIVSKTDRNLSEKGLEKGRKIDSNSILVTCIGATIGKICMIKEKGSCNQQLNAITPNEYFFPDFIYYTIQKTAKNLLLIAGNTATPILNKKSFGNLSYNFPSFDEQKKIALFIDKIDRKIELLEKKHETYQDFKKYLMQQIFAQKLRFDKTSEWETFALNDLGKTYNGLSGLSKDNFEKGNSKYITYKSIFDNNILKSDFTENVELNNKSQNEVKKGDLFFTGSSETPEEVGMVSVLNSTVEDCYLNSFCFGFRLNNNYDINPLFLAYYLRSPIMRNKIMILAQGSTRFNLSKKEILKLKVEIPPFSEQQSIIDLFQNVDNKINEISMQTDNFNEFKKGLLQQMFINQLLKNLNDNKLKIYVLF